MMLLQINNLSKSFGAEPILSNIKLEVKTKEKVAIVGKNGAGKSTLLKIIAGEIPYDSGEIIIPKHVTIGYLAQQTQIQSEKTIWEEMLSVFEPVKKLENELRDLERKMADKNLLENETAYKKLLQEYDKLQLEFQEKGGYRYEADIRSVLHGLKFHQFDYATTRISTLSGGQKTRLALAKLLLTKPDLLILDEPTNHLDLETLSWLEQYLYSYEGAVIIVSHDRYFLDKIVSIVYELSNHKITKYHGNYSRYVVEKQKRLEAELKEYEKQQEFIKRTEEFIQKNIARASTTKRAQSRKKMLEKIVPLEKPIEKEKTAAIAFHAAKKSGNIVLTANDLSVAYNGKTIFQHVNLHVTNGERLAIIGPNGIGKSTLLKAITKQIPYNGTVEHGANVTIGYYDQEQENLTPTKTVLQELWDEFPSMLEKDVRSVLGQFLFSGDDVFKLVSSLSGGEKSRLALAKLMLKEANLLILDEPTNHLDLDSKEMLESALLDYSGTIIFVSHDRFFINRLATKVIELSPNGTTEYLGNYDYYIEKKSLQDSTTETTERKKDEANHDYLQAKEKARLERKLKRQLQEIESQIEQLENEIHALESQLLTPEVYEDYEKALEINGEIEKKKTKLEQLYEKWEQLQES